MKRASRRGSAMIEAALFFSVAMAALIGAADLGRRAIARQWAAYAAREGTRFAEVRGADSPKPATPDEIARYVRGLAVGVDPDDVRVKTQWFPDNQPGSRVTVTVETSGQKASSTVALLR